MRVDDLEQLTNFHDKLNPQLWDNNRLKPQVRLALFKIAKEFLNFINIADIRLTDITVSGSNASFNYTPVSDIDLHLIADVNGPCKVDIKEMFMAKKSAFNDQHDITIFGHSVEVYVQNSDEKHISNGIYSVYDDNWIKFPKKITAQPDISNIEDKFEYLHNEIDQAVDSGDRETIERLKKKIKTMRQSGLDKDGEYGVDNLAFKLLRNEGDIEKLYKAGTEATDTELSLGQQGVAEGLSESRNSLFAFVKQQFPTWPDYVLKDFLYQQAKGIRDQAELDDFLKRNKQDFGNCKWTLTKLPITVDIFTPKTQRMLASREGGSSNPFQVPRDAERHAQQSQMIQQKGVSAEPIIVAKLSNGYDLIEGWHRTIQHLKAFPQGYTGPAWVCTGATYKSESVEQGVAEGKLIESAVFLNPTTVIVGQAHGQPLELSPNTLKQIQAIAAKHGAYYEGNGTDRAYTKGQIDRYIGSWDDEVAKTASPNDPKWVYVLFANVDDNNRVQRVGIDPKDTIFNRLLATAKDNSFQGIGYTSQALQKFLQMSSEGQYDFVKMSQQPATQENLTRFLKAGEALMWPSNWEQYPNKAGKIAKAATVDVRDQYLATRKAGVYVTGSGHLKAVQNITGKQGVAEGNAFLGALNTARKNNLEYFIVDGKKYKVKKNKKIVKEEELTEKWSKKYKRSIDCSHPKGFSQKAHCAVRKKK